METETLGIKSLRMFFSYSTKDKKIVGELKDKLEKIGFEVFLAHEDLKPLVEWQEEIIKNLVRCDIFIPVFTENFKESEWTNQEVGIAVATNKFIIPLQVTVAPFGFIGKFQSLKANATDLEVTTKEIVKLIKNRSQFSEDLKNFVINSLALSGSFEDAKVRSKLLEDFENFSQEQVNRILTATKENNQIHSSFAAKKVLLNFFEKYKRDIKKQDYDAITKLLTEY